MKLRILGCSGGIGGQLRTTSMLLDNDILIDAGTGVGNLSFKQLTRINHVFVTHSHLDHVSHIPFLVDTVGWMQQADHRARDAGNPEAAQPDFWFLGGQSAAKK